MADEFSSLFGYEDYEELVQHSETLYEEDDISWYITQTKGGRWGAWDDAEIAKDRIEWFDTRQGAVQYMDECWQEQKMYWEAVKRDMERESDYLLYQEEIENRE